MCTGLWQLKYKSVCVSVCLSVEYGFSHSCSSIDDRWCCVWRGVWCVYCHSLPVDPTLTINNLRLATSSVQDWMKLGDYVSGLGIPGPVLREISTNPAIMTEEGKMTAMLQYFLNNVPMASWQKVAGALYWMKEEKALHAVKKFLTVSRGQSVVLCAKPSAHQGHSQDFWKGECLTTFPLLLLPYMHVHVHEWVGLLLSAAFAHAKHCRIAVPTILPTGEERYAVAAYWPLPFTAYSDQHKGGARAPWASPLATPLRIYTASMTPMIHMQKFGHVLRCSRTLCNQFSLLRGLAASVAMLCFGWG